MSNLIDERDERTRKRKKNKRKMDSIIGLSYNGEIDKDKNVMSLSTSAIKLADKSIRLLDEGFCDNGFVIKKGTLEKYLNGENQFIRGWEMTDDGWTRTEVLNLTDDYVGNVNLGHMDFAVFPFVLGEWKKEDMTLVDIENDRKAIDVKLNLDKNSVFVKELARQPYDIGVSAEFYYHVNDEDTDKLSEMLGYYLPVIDEIFIFAYGLVGECGNVNSSGLELKGETMLTDKETLATENVDIEIELDGADEEAEEIEEAVETAEAEEANEEALDVETEDADVIENATDDETDEEAEIEEESEETELAVDEDEGEEAGTLEEAFEIVEALRTQVEALTDTVAELTKANEALKKSNRRLNKKLADEKELKEQFLASTKDLVVELLPNENESKEDEKMELAVDNEYFNGDGITG